MGLSQAVVFDIDTYFHMSQQKSLLPQKVVSKIDASIHHYDTEKYIGSEIYLEMEKLETVWREKFKWNN